MSKNDQTDKLLDPLRTFIGHVKHFMLGVDWVLPSLGGAWQQKCDEALVDIAALAQYLQKQTTTEPRETTELRRVGVEILSKFNHAIMNNEDRTVVQFPLNAWIEFVEGMGQLLAADDPTDGNHESHE